jgi:hypothetical protein
MNSDDDIKSFVKIICDEIEKQNGKIDIANILGTLIGICHTIGEDSGYSRKEWNHILKELIKKNYRYN